MTIKTPLKIHSKGFLRHYIITLHFHLDKLESISAKYKRIGDDEQDDHHNRRDGKHELAAHVW